MTNNQISFLNFIYDGPKTIAEVYSRFGLDRDGLVSLTYEIQKCFYARKEEPFENTILLINNAGKEAVEKHRASKQKDLIEWIRYGITTAIAIAAFIKSFFF